MRGKDNVLSRHMRLLKVLFKFRLSNQMIYRASFWTAFFVDVSLFVIQMVVFNTLFLNVDSLNGWNKYQMIIFIGTFTLVDGINMFSYFFGIINIPMKIREGKLDTYLTKPVNTLFWLTFESIDFGSAFITLPGLLMVLYGAIKLGLPITIGLVLGYLFLILLMCLLMYDLMLIFRTFSFKFIKVDALGDLENELIGFSMRVPGVVFKGVAKFVLYVILPYAIIATIPTQFFTVGLSLGVWLLTLSVVAGFTLLAQLFWRYGLKSYGSASS